MPMNVAALTNLIETKTQQKLSQIDPANYGSPNEYGAAMNHASAEAIAEAVIEHIQAAAQVLPGIAVATTGNQSAQTGTTTAPGEIL